MNRDKEKLKLLVIDDDTSIRKMVAMVLVKSGFHSLEAPSGKEGLRLLDENPDIALVVLDWMMPEMDGIEVLGQIQNRTSPPPVLMLTSKSSKEDVITALSAGAKDYLVKPVTRARLLAKVNSVIEHEPTAVITQRKAQRKALHLAATSSLPVIEITEKGCLLESSFALEPGAIIFLESQDIVRRLELPWDFRLSLRVTDCEGRGTHNKIHAEFIGLTVPIIEKIKQACNSRSWA